VPTPAQTSAQAKAVDPNPELEATILRQSKELNAKIEAEIARKPASPVEVMKPVETDGSYAALDEETR
jgi:hypothetical protein